MTGPDNALFGDIALVVFCVASLIVIVLKLRRKC